MKDPGTIPSTEELGAPLLRVDGLTVAYGRGRKGRATAAREVSFDIRRKETVGLVGESGSGKTSVARAILGLAPATAGQITLDGHDITHARGRLRRRLSAKVQAVFQDPYSSLSPTRTIGQSLEEPLCIRHDLSKAQRKDLVDSMLQQVGLDPSLAVHYPAQFSGGQRQRIAIARALIAGPELVICDEPVSALDLSVQAQVLNLLGDLQESLGVGYLFIAHDLAVVRRLSHRIVVLYRGQVVETGNADVVYTTPAHPYTQTLIAAAPVPDPAQQALRRQRRLEGRAVLERSDRTSVGSGGGCPFVARCTHAVEICSAETPVLTPATHGSFVACHRSEDVSCGRIQLSSTSR